MERDKFSPVARVARALGLPVGWLKAEVDAGRVPSLPVGRRRFVRMDQVEQALEQRMQQSAAAEPGEVAHAG